MQGKVGLAGICRVVEPWCSQSRNHIISPANQSSSSWNREVCALFLPLMVVLACCVTQLVSQPISGVGIVGSSACPWRGAAFLENPGLPG